MDIWSGDLLQRTEKTREIIPASEPVTIVEVIRDGDSHDVVPSARKQLAHRARPLCAKMFNLDGKIVEGSDINIMGSSRDSYNQASLSACDSHSFESEGARRSIVVKTMAMESISWIHWQL